MGVEIGICSIKGWAFVWLSNRFRFWVDDWLSIGRCLPCFLLCLGSLSTKCLGFKIIMWGFVSWVVPFSRSLHQSE